MGSEQSTASHFRVSSRQRSFNRDNKQETNLHRQQTIHNAPAERDPLDTDRDCSGSISPGPSVSSDTELPYISYTVNRPIGDSPKLITKQVAKAKARKAPPPRAAKPASHSIVVVKSASASTNIDRDPDILRLQSIPMFLPIMRATLNLPAARDPEVLERLDPAPLHRLCVKYQSCLTNYANIVAMEQNALLQRARDVDAEVSRCLHNAADRQKRLARCVEKFGRIQEISHQLNRCHMVLNRTLEAMEALNNFLDIDDRLEPFVWTTG